MTAMIAMSALNIITKVMLIDQLVLACFGLFNPNKQVN